MKRLSIVVLVSAAIVVSLGLSTCKAAEELFLQIENEVSSSWPSPPDAPSELQAAASGESQIELAWKDNSHNEEHFQIQRRNASSSEWRTIFEALPDSTTYTDNELSAASSYYYRVRATNKIGPSDFTAEVMATTAATVTYGVAYYGNGYDGGTVPSDSRSYEQGDLVDVSGPGTMSRSGYTFVGWDTESAGGGTFYLSGDTLTMPAHDVDLHAQWTDQLTYTLTYDGNAPATINVPVDNNNYRESDWVHVTAPGAMALEGHTFQTWNTQTLGTGTTYPPNSDFRMGSSNIVLYAQWTVNQYGVMYYGNEHTGGFPPSTVAHDYDETVTVAPPGDLERAHYGFAGWNTDPLGAGIAYAPDDTFTMPAHDVSLYAQWTINSHTVSYDGNVHTSGDPPAASVYDYGTQVSVLGQGDLLKTGHSYAGWNTHANGSGAQYSPGGSFFMPDEDVTLYAQWSVNQYGLTYLGNGNDGGTPPGYAEHDYAADVMVADPGDLSLTGHSFTGWNTAGDASGAAYAAGSTLTMPASAVTLHAQWTINQYTLTYDANGATHGSAPSPVAQDYNTTVTVAANEGILQFLPNNAEAFKFGGWNTEPDGTGTDYEAGVDPFTFTADTTLYAKWVIFSEYDLDIGPAGGRIFYDKGEFSDGWRYLEASLEDQSAGAEWGFETSDMSFTNDGLGEGLINTAMLYMLLPSSTAAYGICETYTIVVNGITFSDWYLPTPQEMNYMASMLGPIGNFSSGYYWSSLNHDQYFAIACNLNNGGSSAYELKYELLPVRAIRQF